MGVRRGSELYRTEERKALERGWEISCFSQNFLTLVGLCGVPEFRQPDLEVLDDSQMFFAGDILQGKISTTTTI